jgi:hypothetical protein
MEYATLIEKIISDKYYLSFCKKVCGKNDIYQDLYQHVILTVLELPKEKLLEINKGNLKGYITRIIYISANSKTSPFFLQNYDHAASSEAVMRDIPEEEPLTDDFEIRQKVYNSTLKTEERIYQQNGEFAFQVNLFKIWIKEGSYLKTAKKTKIPYPTVRYNVSNFIKKINENLNNNNH